MHLFKIAGSENYRNLGEMTSNSWNQLDTLFEGLIGYFSIEDKAIELYWMEQGRIHDVTMVDNELGSVQDRCEGTWVIQLNIPCTGWQHHTCYNASACICGTLSTSTIQQVVNIVVWQRSV
jgi:hypothetical protein